MECLVTLTDL